MSEVSPPMAGGPGPAPPTTESPAAPTQDTSTVQDAKEKASEVTGQAQEKAQEAAGQAKSRARDEIDRRSTEAGQQASSTADDLRSVSEQLREQGKDTPAKLADQAAERVERVGGYLQDADADRILGDVEDMARRQPWAVVAGGIALGFVAARFLKASSSERYQQKYSSPSPAAGRPSAGNGRAGISGEGLGNAPRPYADPSAPATPLTTGVTPATPTGL